jgi:hypothetical protein
MINNYRIFRPITHALSIQKRSKIVKNEHAWYTLERFPTDNARVICTKKVSENTVLRIKHNFQLKLVCSIHSVALLYITLFKSKKIRCALSVLQKECRKVWGARYRSENTVSKTAPTCFTYFRMF